MKRLFLIIAAVCFIANYSNPTEPEKKEFVNIPFHMLGAWVEGDMLISFSYDHYIAENNLKLKTYGRLFVNLDTTLNLVPQEGKDTLRCGFELFKDSLHILFEDQTEYRMKRNMLNWIEQDQIEE